MGARSFQVKHSCQKKIHYRKYEHSDESKFLEQLRNELEF